MLMFLPWYILVYSQVQLLEFTKMVIRPRPNADIFFYKTYKESIKKSHEDEKGRL